MDVLGAVAAVALGAVFVIAGAAKLALGAAWPTQARAMGAPTPIATAMPAVELLIGAALITRIAMPLPALAAIVLLMAFSVLIARQLVDGRHPPCACFGAWSNRPLSGTHLARNAVLVVLAVVSLWAR